MIDVVKLEGILQELRSWRDKCCAECVDDPEDILNAMPEFFSSIVPEMEMALGKPTSELYITVALYGTDDVIRDVTKKVQEQVAYNRLNLRVDNSNLGGDPAPGYPKALTLTYTINGKTDTIVAREQQTIKIPE